MGAHGAHGGLMGPPYIPGPIFLRGLMIARLGPGNVTKWTWPHSYSTVWPVGFLRVGEGTLTTLRIFAENNEMLQKLRIFAEI